MAGHGGQTKDLDGDEDDGYDEVIYPVDFRQNGHITDDEMHRIMVRPLQQGVRLTAIFDSCHSGTALDLPYIYSTQGILKEPNLAKEAGQGLLGAVSAYSRGDLGGVASNIMGFFKKATNSDDAYARSMAIKTSTADVIMFSGSKDDQTSSVHPFFSNALRAMFRITAPCPPRFSSRSVSCLFNRAIILHASVGSRLRLTGFALGRRDAVGLDVLPALRGKVQPSHGCDCCISKALD